MKRFTITQTTSGYLTYTVDASSEEEEAIRLVKSGEVEHEQRGYDVDDTYVESCEEIKQ